MGLFNESLGISTDTLAIQAGDLSFGDKVGGVVGGAVISGLGSIVNTGMSVANALGGDFEEINTYNTLRDLDENWGSYYKENKNAIDIAGFIGTALLPGTLAVKGLNAIRAGETANALGRGLNFARTQQARAIQEGLTALAEEGGTVFTRLNQSKMAAMSWEVADQVLQAAVFETAVALTMKQSPLLADESWWNIGKGIATGAAFGGAIGGGIGSLLINRGFKEAAKSVDLLANKYTALSGLDRVGLETSDRAYGIIDSISKVGKDAIEGEQLAKFNFTLGGENRTFMRDLSGFLDRTKKASVTSAMQDFELNIRKIASGSDAASGGKAPDVAESLANFVVGKYNELKQSGVKPEELKERLGDYLLGLKRVTAATDDRLYKADDLLYFKKSLTPEEQAKITSIEDLKTAVSSTTPFGDKTIQAYNKPYVFVGSDLERSTMMERIAIIGKPEADNGFLNLTDAWKAGHDIAILSDGTLRINQASKLWKRVEDPVYDPRRYLNTRTGALTDEAVLTAADTVVPGKLMKISIDGVEFETTTGLKRATMSSGFKADGSLDYITARHAWASQLKDAAIPKVIDANDFSLLERLRSVSADKLQDIQIRHADGTLVPVSSLQEFILSQKIDAAKALFAAGEMDIREVAYRLATSEEWVEQLIATEFGSALKNLDPLAKGLSRELVDFTKRENLIATYTTPSQFSGLEARQAGQSWQDRRDLLMTQARSNGGQFVTGELAYAYRVQSAIKANQNAAASVLGADKIGSLVKLDQDSAKLADSLGSGSSFLGSANASYGETLRLAAQDIGKHVHKWIGEASDTVTSAFATPSTKILANQKAAAELGIVTNILRNDAGKFVLDLSDSSGMTLINRDIAKIVDPAKRQAGVDAMNAAGQRVTIKIENADTMAFLKTHQALLSERIEKERVLVNARGFTSNKDSQVFYAPPIDTNYFQHFALVRPIEGKAFGTSEVSMVFGRNAEELRQRMAAVDTNLFEVITKDQSEKFFKAKGLYDFDQTINERNIDSALRRSGALANYFPETRAQNIVEDYLRYNQNQAGRLIRNSVESNYSQQIQELRQLGSTYVSDATSKFSGTLRSAKGEITNPYDDVVKTMMDISKRSEYTFFHQANEFVDALGIRAYAVLSEVTGKAQKGLLPWKEANEIAEKHGIKGMYSNDADYFLSNAPRDRNIVKEFVAKANTLISTLVLRFDAAQALMNVVSTPLLLSTELASIRTLVARDSELAGVLKELTSVKVPGQQVAVPSTMKLLSNSIVNYFGPESKQLIERYTANGDIKGISTLYHEAIGDLAMSPNFKVFSEGVEKAADKVGRWTGNNGAEEITRFVAADVMRQITEPLLKAGKMDLPTQNAYISTFVNRVQGNYISSQRPIVFQGVLGGAVSLFQTYSFNLLQQLLRHVETGDKKAVMTLFGMQTGLFGLNGTPMFDAVNTHLIGNSSMNQGHHDAYSLAPGLLGKEMGDWLMYGTVSAMPFVMGDKWPALYTRGDINPRHMTILPIMPQDIPAIDASIRVVSNLLDVGKKLTKGADISETLLQGLEHNGLNRPLAGVAQAVMGHTTTSRGSLISASSDMDLITTASRIIGAKPMDEAIALNNMYRIKSYVAADQERMSSLGERVKTKLIGNQVPSAEEFNGFMKDYASIGGRLESFNSSMNRWMRDSNTSVIQQMNRNLNSPYAQRLSEIMGGQPLEDYRNTPVVPEQP